MLHALQLLASDTASQVVQLNTAVRQALAG